IHLIPGTLRENIAFGVAPEFIDDQKVKKAMQMAQLSDFDPERIISADGNNLSGGQRQRIGIARALYRDVKLLILDEATSNLDTETEQAFVAALNNLKGKLTLIVIAHRENTLEQCDKIIRLSSNGD
ncbi:MAG: ATP-binding cassette domain-containing protein, partial [Lentisphaeria bacterium]|nr:ATP-binding cassette domain-containing protein [Lentisphaeria bacterium]